MNKHYIFYGLIVLSAVLLILFSTGELKGPVIIPDYVPFIPSQKGPSRGGELMYEFANLGVPGWKWGNCCSA
tara:strand:- start:3376 stop:3591 length:216 start_codon:yes stop_codon:yes gene_type:complete